MSHTHFGGFQPLDTVLLRDDQGIEAEATFIRPNRGGDTCVVKFGGCTHAVRPEMVARNITAESEEPPRAERETSCYEGPA